MDRASLLRVRVGALESTLLSNSSCVGVAEDAVEVNA